MVIHIPFHPMSLKADLIDLLHKWSRFVFKIKLKVANFLKTLLEFLTIHPSAYLEDQILFLYDTFDILFHKSTLSRMIKAKKWTQNMVYLYLISHNPLIYSLNNVLFNDPNMIEINILSKLSIGSLNN